MLAIVAPHTSNWDFPLGIAAVYALGLRVRFLGKHTLFYPPLGWLMRWFGGTPVIRHAPQGAVAQVVEVFQREPAIFLAVAPAGTRKPGTPWRSGFYYMAHAAGVPIMPIAFDGARRAIRLFPPFETSGDYDADLPRLMALYALGPSAHVKPDRERIRDGASSNRANKGSPVGEDRQTHGVQTGRRRRENLAAIEGRKPVAKGHRRHQIPKRNRGRQNAGSPRRLINLVTQSPA